MSEKHVVVEVLTASGCGRCEKAKALAKAVIAEVNDSRVYYRETNVVEHIDYAVSLGMRSTPAIALDGTLFPGLPTYAILRQAILDCLNASPTL